MAATMIEMDDGARLRTWTAGPAIPQRLPLVMLHGGPGALSWFTDYADRARAWDWALAAARTLRPVNYAMNTQLNAAKKADPLESHVDELRELLPSGAVIIGGAGDTRPAAALRRLGADLNCEVIIIPDAGPHPWLEAPGLFAAALRAAANRQARTIG